MERFDEIIGAFPAPSAPTLARAISRKPGLVRQWRHRNWIPAHEWAGVADAAQAFGLQGVTVEAMAAIARRQRADAPEAPGPGEGVPANA